MAPEVRGTLTPGKVEETPRRGVVSFRTARTFLSLTRAA